MAQGTCALQWPDKPSTLHVLAHEQWEFWCTHGYLVVPSRLPPSQLREVVHAIHGFLGTREDEPETWYRWEYDIYTDTVVQPGGRQARPPHGPCGMVQMYHHSSLWENRQSQQLHDLFCDIHGTHRLWVTCDRAHFKPPERPDKPAWSDPGRVHSGLHWDTDISIDAWPIPYGVQGVLCLEDTPAECGAIRLVPGFHRQLQEWVLNRTNPVAPVDPELWSVHEEELPPAIAVGAQAGDIILWHSALPHGPGPNVSNRPRYSQYITMIPVDAPRPVGMNDSATLHNLSTRRSSD
eukprot:SAG31_NODE_7387_length_1703_cov_1.706983_1_plen_292_part_10